MDVNTLIAENMGRLTLAARKLSRNFGVPDMLEDLVQEGSLALMEAAERYDTSGDVSFDAYSDRIIKSAMLDYIYRNATQFTMPPDRFRVLRRVARLLTDGGDGEICGDLNVSHAVARKLILEYHETFSTVPLDDAVADTDDYGNPEQVYTEKLQRTAALNALNSLSSRSRTIIKYPLGMDQPDEQTMTFQDLAVRLNYNSPVRRTRHTNARRPSCGGSSTPESTAAGGRRSKLSAGQMRRRFKPIAISHGQRGQ